MGNFETETVKLYNGSFRSTNCPLCKIVFLIPVSLYNVGVERADGLSIYCPNGHPWHFTRGESEADKLRRERDRLRQRIAEKDDEIALAERKAAQWRAKLQAAEKETRRVKTRANGGVCPCCSRHFVQVERHMKTKHPGFVAEQVGHG